MIARIIALFEALTAADLERHGPWTWNGSPPCAAIGHPLRT